MRPNDWKNLMLYEDGAPPYALTRAPQGAALADRRSRIRGALDLCDVFLGCGIAWLAAGFSLGSNA